MRYLLDTNICIHIIRQKSLKLIQHITSLAIHDVVLPAIVVAELQYGVQKSADPHKNQQALLQFLTPYVIVDFDEAAALAYGRIRADLEQRGLPIGPLDLLIAAQALSRNLILVTNNTREFTRIARLQVEDWSLL